MINNFEPVNFNTELQQILYSKKDTVDSNNILHESIFVYSNNKDTLYKVNFTNVGDGNGNYILDSSLINGTVFKWIEPVNGEPRETTVPLKF